MQKNEELISAVLDRLNIEKLNEMQLASIEAGTSGRDVVLLSATGTGKTLAFLLPILLSLDADNKQTQALVVVPTRELALQIEQVFRAMQTGFKVTCCYGGHLRETEENSLQEAPAFIIGTPGRLTDHLKRGNIQTEALTTLVLDEFDKSLEFGFLEEIEFILQRLKALRKRMLTSATGALEIPGFIGLKDPLTLNFLPDTPAPALALQLVRTSDRDKLESLFSFICLAGNRSAIVFCNHRESVERVSHFLSDKGIVNVFYHGALEQPERDSALFKFRSGTSNVLVTTDLASRGLDIPNIRYIIHYHLPVAEDVFTHRNGRTARMDASGTAVILLGPDEKLPPFISKDIEEIHPPDRNTVPDRPKWSTLYISAGKKDKINKVDIVGFLTQKGRLKKEDVGLIEVKDHLAYAAIRKSQMSDVLQNIKNEKIKNRKIKIDIAK